ncbi:hypothetical protein TOC8171_07540 [Pseudomonas syringae]
MSMIKQGLGLSVLALSVAQASTVLAVTPMTGNEVEARVGAMLDNMTQSEKINFSRVDDGRMIPKLDKFNLQGTVAYDSAMGVLVAARRSARSTLPRLRWRPPGVSTGPRNSAWPLVMKPASRVASKCFHRPSTFIGRRSTGGQPST